MIRPNGLPKRAVPKGCTKNIAAMMINAIGTTGNDGNNPLSPSTAETTVMAE